jgi:hypothetical protein
VKDFHSAPFFGCRRIFQIAVCTGLPATYCLYFRLAIFIVLTFVR